MRKTLAAFGLTFCALLLTLRVHAQAGPGPEDWLLQATRKWTPYYTTPAVMDKTTGKTVVLAETLEDHELRRRQIVQDVLRVALDPEMPALFQGPTGRLHTALFVLSVFHYESSFNVRVDKHHCAGLPKSACDGGSAWCLGQIHPKDVAVPEDFAKKHPELSWDGPSLQETRAQCVRATIFRLRQARGTCPNLKGHDAFAHYATGKCEPSEKMRMRVQLADAWAKHHPFK